MRQTIYLLETSEVFSDKLLAPWSKQGLPTCGLAGLALPREFERWQKLLYDRTYSARQSFARSAA